jgi:hypothetical protein
MGGHSRRRGRLTNSTLSADLRLRKRRQNPTQLKAKSDNNMSKRQGE